MFFGIVLAAAVVQGISGFAFNIVVMSVIPYLFLYTDCQAIATMLSTVVLVIMGYLYRRHIVWKWILVPLISYFIMLNGSIRVMKYTAEAVIWYQLLGVFFLLMAVYMMYFQDRIKIQPNWRNGLLVGGISGTISGLFCVGGPPIVLYLLGIADTKEKYMGTLQMFFIVGNLLELATRAANGMITLNSMQFALYSLPFLFLGFFIGYKIFYHIKQKILNNVIYTIMIVNGLYMVVR